MAACFVIHKLAFTMENTLHNSERNTIKNWSTDQREKKRHDNKLKYVIVAIFYILALPRDSSTKQVICS